MEFYEIIKRVARQISDVRMGISTGGSSTTLVDTELSAPNDYYNGGLIFMDQSTPIIKKVLDWDSSTFTFTFSTVSPALTSGIAYSVMNENYPLDVLKMAINQALVADIGLIMGIDETLTPVDGQERYILPEGVYDLKRVEIGTEDEGWKVNYSWREELGELRFMNDKPQEGTTIRVHYVHSHDELIDLDDVLDSQIPADLIIHAACARAIQWRREKVQDNEPALKDKLAYHETRFMFAKSRVGIRLLNRDPIHSRL